MSFRYKTIIIGYDFSTFDVIIKNGSTMLYLDRFFKIQYLSKIKCKCNVVIQRNKSTIIFDTNTWKCIAIYCI